MESWNKQYICCSSCVDVVKGVKTKRCLSSDLTSIYWSIDAAFRGLATAHGANPLCDGINERDFLSFVFFGCS